jgi:exodeoxyribonuclease-5
MPRIAQSKPVAFIEPKRATDAHRQLTVADLSPDQHEAYSAITTWLNRGTLTKKTLTLGGFAGSGKSALVSVLAHEMPAPLAFCAFTGKASSVLGRKLAASGIETVNRIVSTKDPLTGERPFEPRPYCGTIHGLVFRPCDACMVEKVYQHTFGDGCTADVDDDGLVVEGATPIFGPSGKCLACDPPPPVKREGHCNRCNDGRYLRRDRLDRTYRLIVIDEASMVSDDMLAALQSYGIPILAVGDHGQLPPVKGTGSLMRSPDIRLEKIHRQAAGNPIIALSARIRETGEIDDALEDGVAFTILAQRNFNDWIAKRFTPARLKQDPSTPAGIMGTVLVSWTNRLRVGLNYDVRAALGLEGAPTQGEAVICLKNAAPIYNGMRGVLRADAIKAVEGKAPKWKATVDFTEDNQVAENILMSEHQFFEEKTIDYDKATAMGVSMAQLGALYDFGYGLTCHKMQGSQAHEVAVVVEGGMARMSKDDRIRWMYTSCTRASSRLCVVR